uniref:Gonadotropin subunit beta-2 n=1 Tax=Neogobius melanostomus TaxID=47308 RepID=A0A8C6SBS5_9GOBI
LALYFNMETAIFSSLLWAVLFSPAVPMCLPSDFTLYVEKPECDFCVAINTTICMGFCRTKVPVSFCCILVCTYDKVEYRTTMLPGCSANPLFTYPVALSCHCSTCRTENNDCVQGQCIPQFGSSDRERAVTRSFLFVLGTTSKK